MSDSLPTRKEMGIDSLRDGRDDKTPCHCQLAVCEKEILYWKVKATIYYESLEHLHRELAAARMNERRYRWLRQWVGKVHDMPVIIGPKTPEEMDAVIDSIMEVTI